MEYNRKAATAKQHTAERILSRLQHSDHPQTDVELFEHFTNQFTVSLSGIRETLALLERADLVVRGGQCYELTGAGKEEAQKLDSAEGKTKVK